MDSRRDAPAKGAMTLEQSEHFHFVSAAQLKIIKRSRLTFPGMNTCGTIMGPISFPTKAQPQEYWQLTIGEKKKYYGNARLLPGGPSPDGAVAQSKDSTQKRTDATKEPMTHFGYTSRTWSELLYQVGNISGDCD